MGKNKLRQKIRLEHSQQFSKNIHKPLILQHRLKWPSVNIVIIVRSLEIINMEIIMANSSISYVGERA